ncbi:ankyrin [Mollisia scopiformis]|uniref:Ankyrin n=1 Tax=Mollisia scopiformis TaxID=149040 RepID=A0A194WS59_MOLSC|nr:ankyrin [Mollisia scopiformis]KUJ10808.1 ankyrin [Mollisia scopiformis]
MSEPQSILTRVGSLLSTCLRLAQGLNNLHARDEIANRSIIALSTECITTSLALSSLQNILPSRLDLLSSVASSSEELTASFETAILGVASTLSILDGELSARESVNGLLNEAKYLWDEALSSQLGQQIRDQCSSIHHLIDILQSENVDNLELQMQERAQDLSELRRHASGARALRGQLQDKSRGDDLESIFSLATPDAPFQIELSSSRPYQKIKASLLIEENVTHVSASIRFDGISEHASTQPDERDPSVRKTPLAIASDGSHIISSSQSIVTVLTDKRANNAGGHESIASSSQLALPSELRGSARRRRISPLAETTQNSNANDEKLREALRVANREKEDVNRVKEKLQGALSKMLYHAIIKRDVKAVCDALPGFNSFGIDLNCVYNGFWANSGYLTPLAYAAATGDQDIAAILLKSGANWAASSQDVNHQYNGMTALIHASIAGHDLMARLLLAHGAMANHADKRGRSPFMYAAANGHIAIMLRLINHGTDIKLTDDEGNSALHWAARNGDHAAVDEIIKQGAIVNLQNTSNQRTPLHEAIFFRRSSSPNRSPY